MSDVNAPADQTAFNPAKGRALDLVLAVFAATLFLSALLLFAVQPMFTKMVLPQLGGSPSVWSVALVFFQGLLLAGYCWAHLLTRLLPLPAAALAHLAFCALAAFMLPIASLGGSAPPSEGGQAFWLLGLFGAAVGLPFFVVSANGPLLQAWFARSGHVHAKDPYFLYAASNLGSFAALVAYPTLIEPLLGLSTQSRLWTWGFALLALALALCAWLARASAANRGRLSSEAIAKAPPQAPVARADILAWIALAFAPSGLLVSVTAHISTDVAAAPLLWVLPLALYLLTFVLGFRDKALVSDALVGYAQVFLTALALVLLAGDAGMALSLAVNLSLFFVATWVAHRALYLRRPQSHDLTIFYVCMSLGGVLGGLFAALAAPLLFSSVLEYPILIVAALLCRPGAMAAMRKARPREVALVAALAFALGGLAHMLATTYPDVDRLPMLAPLFMSVWMLLAWRRPARLVIIAACAMLSTVATQSLSGKVALHRSFFGVHKVREVEDGRFRVLVHGTTMHGAMRIVEPDGAPSTGRPTPATYYSFDGPLGQALASVRADRGGALGHIAAIGLGAGSLACHRVGREPITFYEIDPLVAKIARDSSLFRFLSECAPDAPIVLGDARLTIAAQTALSEVIVVDAFSSDAIPVHLMTRDALALYRTKLAPRGVILFHISNNVMEFSGIVARIAAELGLKALVRSDRNVAPDNPDFRSPSMVAAVVADPADLGAGALASGEWKLVAPDMASRPWTDDYSTILPAMAAKWRNP